MNTENIIEYIRRGVGLRQTKLSCWIEAFSFLLMSCGLMIVGTMVGGHPKFWGITTFVSNIVHIVFTIVFIRKKSPLKNKFIVGATSSFLFICLFGFFLACFSAKNLGFYYMLMVLIPVFFVFFYAFRLNSPKPFFRKKRSINIVSASKMQSRTALAKLVLGIVAVYFSHSILESFLNIVFMVIIILLMYSIPLGLLDLQRYYYYTKLEKMGLVTEDILKPEE